MLKQSLPDVINGAEDVQDELLRQWPFAKQAAMPVWHLHASLERLCRLVEDEWWRVAVGSSGAYATPSTARWDRRVDSVFNAPARRYGTIPPLHMLRAATVRQRHWPFASADSTTFARHVNAYLKRGETVPEVLSRVEAASLPQVYVVRAVAPSLFEIVTP